jgi:predicted RNase H-like HicB family nuclease
MARKLVVMATWDDEAEVWVANSDDIPGLVTEATNLEKLTEKLLVMVPEVMEANGAATLPTSLSVHAVRFQYAVNLKPAEEGGFVVTCRDLPEVVTQGDDLEQALSEAADAMDEAFASRIKRGDTFPEPSAPKRGEHIVSPPAEMVARAVRARGGHLVIELV